MVHGNGVSGYCCCCAPLIVWGSSLPQILDVPIPADCHAQNHADYAGNTGVIATAGSSGLQFPTHVPRRLAIYPELGTRLGDLHPYGMP